MAKTIVRGRQDFVDELKNIPKWETVTVGVSSDNPDVVLTGTGTFALFNLPSNILILDARSSVIDAFTAVVDIEIGDSDDTDGMIAVAKLDATTASSTLKRNAAVGYFDPTGFKGGVFYSSSGMIINATVSNATPAKGKALIAVEYLLV